MKKLSFGLSTMFVLVCACNGQITNKFAGEYFGDLITTRTNAERVLIDLFIANNREVTVTVLDFDFNEIETGYGTNTTTGKFYVIFPDHGYVLTGTAAGHKASGVFKPVLPTDAKYTFTAFRRWRFPYAP